MRPARTAIALVAAALLGAAPFAPFPPASGQSVEADLAGGPRAPSAPPAAPARRAGRAATAPRPGAQPASGREKRWSCARSPIKFRDPGDVALLVGPLLTDKGSVTTVPKLRTVTVQDRREVLDRIQDVIASYNVPPRNVEFTVTLIMASRAAESGGSISREVRGITEALPDITRWTNYRTLDSVTIAGSEGSRTARELANVYRIDFDLEAVSESRGIIRLNPFSLQKAEKGPGGETVYRPVYTTTVNLKNDKLLTIGATKSETSPKALFLTIRAHIENP